MNQPEMRLAILGDPVSHSLSPAMHEAALRECGLAGSYERIRVKRHQISSIVVQLRRKGYHGFNVTIPHKEAIVGHLQAVDERARRIGAVNTVTRSEVGYSGHNTDTTGFGRILDGLGLQPGKAVVLGAGGAAKGCIDSLTEAGWTITVANRILDRALPLRKLATLIELRDPDVVQQALNESSLVVNATPVGMNHHDESPLHDRVVLRPHLTVVDLVYVPLETRLLLDARDAGCRTVDGMALLSAQAADSFEIWTGKRLPDEFFRQAAMEGAMMRRATTFHMGQFGPPTPG